MKSPWVSVMCHASFRVSTPVSPDPCDHALWLRLRDAVPEGLTAPACAQGGLPVPSIGLVSAVAIGGGASISARVRLTPSSGSCSSRMISRFSAAAYLIDAAARPDKLERLCFFLSISSATTCLICSFSRRSWRHLRCSPCGSVSPGNRRLPVSRNSTPTIQVRADTFPPADIGDAGFGFQAFRVMRIFIFC